MKLKLIRVLSATAAASMLLFSSCGMLPQEEEALAPPVMAPEEVEYVTHEVKIGDIVNELSGSCAAVSKTQYNLSFTEMGGHLDSINVKLGDEVTAGQVLATLDTDSLAKNIEIKKVQISKTNLEIDNILTSAKNELTLLENEVNLVLEKKAELTLRLEDETISDEDRAGIQSEIEGIDDSMINYNIRLENARNNADATKNTSILSKKMDLQIQEIELSDMENTMAKSTITAPTAGTVVFIEEVAVGDYVPALKMLIGIADPQDLVMEYTGTKANSLKVGMAATITVNDTDYAAEVVSTPSNVPVELMELYEDTVLLSFAEIPEGLELADRGNFVVVLEEKSDIIVVPKNAIVTYVGSYYARVLKNGVGNEQSVEVGITSSSEYEIISGLEEGDLLILN